MFKYFYEKTYLAQWENMFLSKTFNKLLWIELDPPKIYLLKS